MPLIRAGDGACFAARVWVARSFRARLQGLLAADPLPEDTVLHLLACRSIHTVGMAYSLDVVFLDDAGTVLKIVRRMNPFRLAWGGWRAVSALEWRAGALSHNDLRVGDRLILAGPPDRSR